MSDRKFDQDLVHSIPNPNYRYSNDENKRSRRSNSFHHTGSRELDGSDGTNGEQAIGALIQRRMELRRALKQMNGELLRLLYEEWTLTGCIPEGYEELLRQSDEKMHPVKTTSFPLPRLLIRRASTLSRPSHDFNHSTSSSQSSVPWTEVLNFHENSSGSPARSVQQLNMIDAETEYPHDAPAANAPTLPNEPIVDSETENCPMHLRRQCSTNSHKSTCTERVESEYSWTEDEEELKRTGYELQLRKLEIDYAVITQLYTVHKQRAIETRKDAYRVAYKSNLRKLKEIREQMIELQEKLKNDPGVPTESQHRGRKSTWQRRKTWNPLRVSAHQWGIATLPRRMSRFNSPSGPQVPPLDVFSTPVTPDRRFKVPLDSPIKPPPSLASDSVSTAVSRASSVASDRYPSQDTRRRVINQRSSLIPLIQFFRHSVKAVSDPIKSNDASRMRKRPSTFTYNKRSKMSEDSEKDSSVPDNDLVCDCSQSEHNAQVKTMYANNDSSSRSSLFFPRRSWKYLPHNTCSSFQDAEPNFSSSISVLRSSAHDPISVVRGYSICSPKGASSIEHVSVTKSPNGPRGCKLRRSLSSPDSSLKAADPMRDSAIDLPDSFCGENHPHPFIRPTGPSHWRSVPEIARPIIISSISCHRSGIHDCATLENEHPWIDPQVHNVVRDMTTNSDKIQIPCSVSRSASSFPSRTVHHHPSVPTDLALRPVPSHASSNSNWSTSGCSCLSSQTASSSATAEHNIFHPRRISTNLDQGAHESTHHNPPNVRLRNPEERGRRFYDAPCDAALDVQSPASGVKCICSCSSEHTGNPSHDAQDPQIDPTPVGSTDCLDRPSFHYPRKRCICSVDSCETTVPASPVQTTSPSPSGSSSDLSHFNPSQKSKTTSDVSDVIRSGLSKAASSRRSMRPFAFLRRAVSRANRPPTVGCDSAEITESEAKNPSGPVILAALVPGRQQIKIEPSVSKNGKTSGQADDDPHVSPLNHFSQPEPPTVLIGDLTGKARFMWTGKFRHSSRGSSLKMN